MLSLYIFLSITVTTQAKMEGFIVGGNFAPITKYPHAAFLFINCVYQDRSNIFFACGGSILNQRILLTAAHCFNSCNYTTNILATVGSEHRANGSIIPASGYLVHGSFEMTTLAYDIAMVKLAHPVQFSSRVRRVAILRNPPYRDQAWLSGWGQTNEQTKEQGIFIKELDQKLMRHYDCVKRFGYMPQGTICAISNNPEEFAAQGDSGSGLIVRGFIQIGLVSYKKPVTAVNTIIYTDVGYYYDWIVYNAHNLYCGTAND